MLGNLSAGQIFGIIIMVSFVFIMYIISEFGGEYNLNNIKRRSVGNGQHGTARWATPKEQNAAFKSIPFTPHLWRKGENLPEVCGTLIACETHRRELFALIDESDVHSIMLGAAGCGKTAFFLYPNIEFACASGMSFISTDTKGDVPRNYIPILEKYYHYKTVLIDLRNPTRSDEDNILYLVNKYMDIYLANKSDISSKARAEKYAKITAKSIISIGCADNNSMGQNAFFYDAAEGLLASVILLLAEFGEPGTRHIVSVFKLINELQEAVDENKEGSKSKVTHFHKLMKRLPEEHKARWLAGSALYSSSQTMMSVISTALSRLNGFIDSEMEQILCFGSDVDIEKFAEEKTAIFIVLPEEDTSKNFMVSLLVQQIYRELLVISDENDGVLKKRVMFYLDELGTFPKISGMEEMFSASRSRKISIVGIIQSFAQIEQKYGDKGKDIIIDNTQLTICGGFAPNSSSADEISKSLSDQTIMTGSVSHTKGKDENSRSLQMIGRPLMTADELKTMPKGQFIVMKTGMHPIISKLKLYFEWGIEFEEKYRHTSLAERKVKYMSRDCLINKVIDKFPKPGDTSKTVSIETEPNQETQAVNINTKFI